MRGRKRGKGRETGRGREGEEYSGDRRRQIEYDGEE